MFSIKKGEQNVKKKIYFFTRGKEYNRGDAENFLVKVKEISGVICVSNLSKIQEDMFSVSVEVESEETIFNIENSFPEEDEFFIKVF